MKINEKNLAAFATSSGPVDKEGWLIKRGEVNKAFQKRWFVLKGNLLFYFEKKGDKEPTGVIILEGCTVELADDDGQFGFKIVFHGQGNRTYLLESESQELMEQWMKAITCSSYDYMKLMVEELQRQLNEMEENISSINDKCNTEAPVPPPRTRHNPFNRDKVTSGSSASLASHHRSLSTRSNTSYRSADSPLPSLHRQRVTFREIHTSYGRPILKDFVEWRHQQRLLNEPLIKL